MPSVAAVVLTYNRLELVRACLAALMAQTHGCTRIVVVDNGSTDGTGAYLASLSDPRLLLGSLVPNRGPAAGFHEAMRLGAETGADFVWIMDDDVIPEPDALAELVVAYSRLADGGMEPPYLLSFAQSPDGAATNVPDIDRRQVVRGYPQWPVLLGAGLVPIRRGTFVSALFDRRTIERHGLPLADMVMWGEDTEYTMRVTRSAPAFLVGRSRVVHLRAQPGSLDIRTERDPARVRMHRLHVRNRIYNARRHLGRRARVHVVLSIAKLALGLVLHGHLRRGAIVGLGLLEGLTFAPATSPGIAPQDHAPRAVPPRLAEG